jgi:hypothetical protein
VTAAVTIDRMAGATQLVSIEIDAGVVVSDSVAILSGVTSGVRDIRFPPVVLPGTYPAKAVLGASVATTQFTVA